MLTISVTNTTFGDRSRTTDLKALSVKPAMGAKNMALLKFMKSLITLESMRCEETFYIFVAVLILCTAAFGAVASNSHLKSSGIWWSKFSVEEKKDLKKGNIIVKMRDVRGVRVKEGIAAGLVKASADDVWNIITDYEHYAEFMPRVLESKIVKREESQLDLFSKLSMPWPVKEVSYVIRLQLDKRGGKIAWNMLPGTGKKVKLNTGGWEVLPWDKKSVLVIYRLLFEPESSLPAFILNSGTRISLREVIRAVRKRASKLAKTKKS